MQTFTDDPKNSAKSAVDWTDGKGEPWSPSEMSQVRKTAGTTTAAPR